MKINMQNIHINNVKYNNVSTLPKKSENFHNLSLDDQNELSSFETLTSNLKYKDKTKASKFLETSIRHQFSTLPLSTKFSVSTTSTQNFSNSYHISSSDHTLILPDINCQPHDFKQFLKRDLLETSTLISLELADRLNWWVSLGVCRRLFPLVTTGDGNCLLHAASLALFGHHDNKLILRKALNRMMCDCDLRDSFFRRWRWNQALLNKQAELVFTEEEWQEEWKNLTKLTSTLPRIIINGSYCGNQENNNDKDRDGIGFTEEEKNENFKEEYNKYIINRNNNITCLTLDRDKQSSSNPDNISDDEILYESLEELHVFILSHVLSRPIIIIADTLLKNLNGEPLAPISFGGIYLPLEISPSQCKKTPLILTYDAAHFSPLVPMDDSSGSLTLAGEKKNKILSIYTLDGIPLVDSNFELLPVHFCFDPSPSFDWSSLDDPSSLDHLPSPPEKRHLFKLLKSYLNIKFLGVPFTYESESTDDSSSKLSQNRSKSRGAQKSRRNKQESSLEEKSLATKIQLTSNEKKKNKNRGVEKKMSDQIEDSCDIKPRKKLWHLKKRLSKTFKSSFCSSGISKEEEQEEKSISHPPLEIDNSKKSNQKVEYSHKNEKDFTFKSESKTTLSPQQSMASSSSPEIISSSDSLSSLAQLNAPDSVLCAMMNFKRNQSQDKLLNNYLFIAKERFKNNLSNKEHSQCCPYVNCRLYGNTCIDNNNNHMNFMSHHNHLINTDQYSTSLSVTKQNNVFTENNGKNNNNQFINNHINNNNNNNNNSLNMCKSLQIKYNYNCDNQNFGDQMNPHNSVYVEANNDKLKCINTGCEGEGVCSETSYLCKVCFERQKTEEMGLNFKMYDVTNCQSDNQQHQLLTDHSMEKGKDLLDYDISKVTLERSFNNPLTFVSEKEDCDQNELEFFYKNNDKNSLVSNFKDLSTIKNEKSFKNLCLKEVKEKIEFRDFSYSPSIKKTSNINLTHKTNFVDHDLSDNKKNNLLNSKSSSQKFNLKNNKNDHIQPIHYQLVNRFSSNQSSRWMKKEQLATEEVDSSHHTSQGPWRKSK